MTRTKLVEDLKAYFNSKGKFLSYQEYILAEDAPFRAQVVKRLVGTWARLEKMVGEIAPKSVPKAAPVAAPVKPQITDAVTTKTEKK
jgi:hypothetical protein